METSPVNLQSVIECNYVEDRNIPEEKKDLETIQSEENENSKEHDDLSTFDALSIGKDRKQSSEKLENMELLQKSTDAMNQLLDNMSNLRVISTIETKEPEFSEALIPETNMENMKSALNAEDSGVAPTNVIVRDLPPMRFHRVHGEYIKMSNDYSMARLVAPKMQDDDLLLHRQNHIVFSSRPIAIDEKVYLRLEVDSRTPVNDVEFGLLDCDPKIFTETKFWELNLRYVSKGFNHEAGVFHFYVKPSGEVCCFMNDTPLLGLIVEKVNINTPLWALIKIPSNVTTVKFIDSPKENKTEEWKPLSVEDPSPTTRNTLTDLSKNNQKLDIKEEETKLRTDEKAVLQVKPVEDEGIGSTALGGGSGVAPTNVTVQDLHPVRFHRVHGKYIKMSKDYHTARVQIPETSEIQFDPSISDKHNYTLFSSRPIEIDEKVYLRLETVPNSFKDLVGFGLTNRDPNSIKSCEWYRDRMTYFSDGLSDKDNIFHFCIKLSGKICFFKNDEHVGSLDKININAPLWAFIELPHNETTVKIIDSPKENETEELAPLSIEKPSSPSTNALDELKKRVDDISNLKLNSTMDREKPETAKALETVTNIGNAKRHFEEEDCAISHSDDLMNVLTPLRFHKVHGQSIKISDDYFTAQITASKNKIHLLYYECLAFSSRPVAVNEKVYLRLESFRSIFLDSISIGLTNRDPNTIVESYDWANCLYSLDSLDDMYNILHFYVTPSGKMRWFMKDKIEETLFSAVNINVPFWAVIRLSYYLNSLKVINSSKEIETEELKPPSTEKPSPPTTNALDEPKKQFDDISNLKLNSTTDREKPETSKALQAETNIGNAKKHLEEEDFAISHSDYPMNVLTPLRFHKVHGQSIKISDDYFTAQITASKNKIYLLNYRCLAFSSRPVAVNEKVYLRLESFRSIFLDRISFGFTNRDPNTIDETYDWANCLYLRDSLDDMNNILHFYVTPSGKMRWFMKDKLNQTKCSEVNINVPFWAVIRLSYDVNSVKVINSSKEMETEELKTPSTEKPSPPTSNALDEPKKRFDDISNLKLNSTMDREKPETSKALQTETNIGNAKRHLEEEDCATSHSEDPMNVLTPLRFHKVHGQSIKISDDYFTAQITASKNNIYLLYYECLAFSSRPVAVNEKVYLRLESFRSIFLESISIGFTNRDPNTIVETYDCFNSVYFWDSFDDMNNILHFYVTPSGKMRWFMKDKLEESLFSEVNINVPFWAVIKLYYYVNSKVINSSKEMETEELKTPSTENPPPPTTNALNEPKKQFDDISNLKLNSTMDREKPETSKALQTETNIGNAKRHLEEEDCATSHSDDAMNVLTPLRFHKVHGQFVRISNNYCTAQSAIPLDKPFLVTHERFAFSSRPVAVNEKVYLRLGKVSKPYNDPFGFGFTDCDPNIVADLLPRLCRFRTCIFGNCLNYLPNHFGTEVNTFYFFVKPSGEVCYGINNKEMGCVSKVINIKIPLWGFIRLSNNISSVKLTESPKENETEDLKSLSEPLQLFPTKINTESRENQKPDIILKTPAPSSGITTEKSTVSWSNGTAISNTTLKNLHDLCFHPIHGKCIKLSPDKTIAKCEMPAIEPYYVAHECYVFSSRPVDINEKVHLKLETVSEKYFNAFSFGFTDCDPSIIPNIMNKLCPSSPCILGNCLFDLSSQYCVKDNYMHFYVNKSGEIHFGINEEEKGVCYRGVNTSSRVWAVIKVTNCVSSVRLERKKQDSFESFFTGGVSSILKVSSTAKEEETEVSSKNVKRNGDDETKSSPANCNVLTGNLRTEVTTSTKGQTLFDWGVESSVKTEPEFNETELKTAQTSEESFKSTLQPSTSNTPAKQIQPTSSIDVENNQESADYCVKHFVKIVEYQLHRIPEHRRMKCMQKILEHLDTASK